MIRRQLASIAIAAAMAVTASTFSVDRSAAATPDDWEGYVAVALRYGPGGQSIGIFAIGRDSRIYRIRTETANLNDPVWSPDGSMIAFRKQTSLTDWALMVMRADGTGARRVTHRLASGFPSWSPDGTRIAFGGVLPGNDVQLFTVGVDGSDLRQLTFGPGTAQNPAWASTGRIYYLETEGPMAHPDLHAIDPDGSDEETLVTGDISGLAVSPDGSTLAYGDMVGANFQLHLMPADGGVATPITVHPSDNFPRSFSPDGERVLFHSTRSGDYGGLFTIRTDGTEETPLLEGEQHSGGNWGIPAFVDAEGSIFAADIEWAVGAGITEGCWVARFCPNSPVTRAQLATFVARAFDVPDTAEDFFEDDEQSPHEADINRLAAAGIVGGCAEARYCPDELVTRAQAASILARALELPPPVADHFVDDDGVHEDDINRIADAGIAGGCAPQRFCPNASLTRGEMVALLHRAVD